MPTLLLTWWTIDQQGFTQSTLLCVESACTSQSVFSDTACIKHSCPQVSGPLDSYLNYPQLLYVLKPIHTGACLRHVQGRQDHLELAGAGVGGQRRSVRGRP